MLSITSAAEAALRGQPDPQIPASAWKARGGVMFASDDARGFWNADKNNIQPRARVRLQVERQDGRPRRLRASTRSPFVFSNGINQMGYSQSTPFTASQNRGLTFQSTLNNPYPLGMLQPAGNTRGPNTFLGQSLTGSCRSTACRTAQLSRYLVNVQRELPGQWLLEVGYVGSHGYNLTTERGAEQHPGAVPLDEPRRATRRRSTSSARSVPNPFAGGLLPTGFTGANVARSQLLRPFPQFSNVPDQRLRTARASTTRRRCRIERRFAKGYAIIGDLHRGRTSPRRCSS